MTLTKTIRKNLSILLLTTLAYLPTSGLAQDMTKNYYPDSLLGLDNFFAHHVIIAEKSTHKLYLYQNNEGFPKLVKTYQMATGKKAGDKQYQGDYRTPEGVYYLTSFLTHQDLLNRHGKQGEIYGVGAFVLNYPNPVDHQEGKTGSGIWLHSTNDETRIEKGLDSRGCIVTANSDLIDISRYIELERTPIIVVHEIPFLSKEAWMAKKAKVEGTISSWLNAWRNEDVDGYIDTYHKTFKDPLRGSIGPFKNYKRAVFANPGKPEIELYDLSLLQSGEYIMATFKQAYKSSTIEDLGRKTLYLKQDEYYNWKIVSENWSKHGVQDIISEEQPHVAFEPSNRFFETNNPRKIMGNRLLSSRLDELEVEEKSN